MVAVDGVELCPDVSCCCMTSLNDVPDSSEEGVGLEFEGVGKGKTLLAEVLADVLMGGVRQLEAVETLPPLVAGGLESGGGVRLGGVVESPGVTG